MNTTMNFIFDIITLVFISMGIVSSMIILYLIFYHRHRTPINPPILLLCNTYLAFLAACLPLLDMYVHNMYGNTMINISLNTWWCYARAYLLHVGLGSIYYSYLLQASFRLYRIVFSNSRQMQNNSFIIRLIILQWILSFILLLCPVFRKDFHYIFDYYYCQIPYEDLRGLAIVASLTYYIPMFIIGSMYFFIINYMRRNRRRTHEKDLAVFRRIVILVGMLLVHSLPAVLLWIGYKITGYLSPFIYHLQWFTFALSLALLPFISALLTPYLRRIIISTFKRNTRIQPMIFTQHHLPFP